MQLKSEKQSILACFLVVLLAYLPVTSFLFAVKNDMFTGYFPLKYFISASLDAGVFPLWNPYLNYGFPIYGDMSLAWWNPGTWIIALSSGYNAWSFTAELIIYLLISVWGMHKMSSLWTSNMHLRAIAAVSYACCGYFVGDLQHFNWVAAAAVIPVVLYALLRYLDTGSYRHLAATAFSSTWLVTIAHPGLIIGTLLFIIILLPGMINISSIGIRRCLIAALLTAACCAGMIFGYAQVLPYTNRSGEVSSLITPEGSTTMLSWISLLFSLPVNRGDWFANDISLRNCFIGILLFAALVLAAGKEANRKARYLAATGMGFLILSSDLFIPVYKHIPVLNFIRLNGELRIFALLSFILSGLISLDRQLQTGAHALSKILKALRIIMGLTMLGAAVILVVYPTENFEGTGIRENIKWFLDHVHPALLFLIHASIQFIVCSALIKAIQMKKMAMIFMIVSIELIGATLLGLPFTGVGQRSVKDIDALYNMAPEGLIKPATKAEKEVVANYPKVDQITGNWALVSKQIAQNELIAYPLVFPSTVAWIESPRKAAIHDQSPFFLRSGTGAPGVEPASFSYSRIVFRIDNPGNDTLVLKQNMFRGWTATNNGVETPLHTTPEGFIAIPLDKNKNELVVSFDNKPIKALLIYQFIMMAALAALYFVSGRRANA